MSYHSWTICLACLLRFIHINKTSGFAVLSPISNWCKRLYNSFLLGWWRWAFYSPRHERQTVFSQECLPSTPNVVFFLTSPNPIHPIKFEQAKIKNPARTHNDSIERASVFLSNHRLNHNIPQHNPKTKNGHAINHPLTPAIALIGFAPIPDQNRNLISLNSAIPGVSIPSSHPSTHFPKGERRRYTYPPPPSSPPSKLPCDHTHPNSKNSTSYCPHNLHTQAN